MSKRTVSYDLVDEIYNRFSLVASRMRKLSEIADTDAVITVVEIAVDIVEAELHRVDEVLKNAAKQEVAA